MKVYRRVWAEVDLDAIRKNVISMRNAVATDEKTPMLCAVIKADGYGHGAVPIAKTVQDMVWGYAVATVDEGVQLREHGVVKPILVLGFADEMDLFDCIRYGIRVSLYAYEQLAIMKKAVDKYRDRYGIESAILYAHVKLDTGMGRLGFLCHSDEQREKSLVQIEEIFNTEEIKCEGCFAHFAKADEMDKDFAKLQAERFEMMKKSMSEKGINFQIYHMDNSAGIIDLPEYASDLVRMGISMYGLYPSDYVNKRKLMLFPAMTLLTKIIHVKTVPAGTPISYGGTFVTDKEMRIGTIPIGYADGYPRALSNKGSVIVCGHRAPIIGRVCMDQCMIDLTDIPEATNGSIVTLVGCDGNECITMEEAAELAGTFNYEFICNMAKRIPRVYRQNGEIVGSKDYIHDRYEDFVGDTY